MVIFIILNLLVIFSARIIIKRFFNNFHTLDKILIGFSFVLAQIVLTEEILGTFLLLTLSNLIIINLFIFLLLIIFCRKKGSLTSRENKAETNFPFFKDEVILFGASILAGFVLVKVFLNLINPPFGWDSLNYHLTFPVEWLKHRNFYTPITINDDPTPSYYPINGGLFYLWFVLPFRDVYLADIGQLPFYIISLIAVFAIARRLGLDNKLSLMASISFAIIPNYLKEIEIAYSDIMMVCLFLLSFYQILIYKERPLFRNFILVCLSLGLLLGIKTASLPYTGILIIYFLFILSKNKKKKIKILREIFVLIIMLVIFGGYGYIRNFILTGNPLYPLDFSLFGRKIFKGVMSASNYKAHWGRASFNYRKLFLSEGLGLQFALLIFPATFLAPLLAWRKKKINFIIFLPLMLFFTFRYIIPQLWTRFLYPYLGIGAIVGFWSLKEWKIDYKYVSILFVLFILFSAGELAGHIELISSLVLGFLLWGIFLIGDKFQLRFKRYIKPILAGFILFLLGALVFGEKIYLKQEYIRYVTDSPYPQELTLAWKYLNDITPEKGANIAYVGRPLPFPLYGTKFKNNVFYISVNGNPPFLHSYKNSYYKWTANYKNMHEVIRRNGNYRGNADYNIWLKNLEQKNIEYLFIYALHETTDFPFEDEWAKSHPGKFQIIFSDNLVHIYKIKHLS